MPDQSALFRKRGIQVTAQRLAVFRAVDRHPHIAADQVASVVRELIGAISLQSVYDALAVLLAAGLIRRIQAAGSPARFEGRVGDNHHHLACRTCGRLVDVPCVAGSAPCLQPPGASGYEIDEAEVVYWGRCADCAARAQTRGASSGPDRSGRPRRRALSATRPGQIDQRKNEEGPREKSRRQIQDRKGRHRHGKR
ncbi:MAG: Fur family transcriptional regulator [Vicinamibacterales bacterium]